MRHYGFDEQELGILYHRPMAVFEDGNGAPVIPVVNNPLKNVSVATAWHRLEEISIHHLTAIRKPFGFK